MHEQVGVELRHHAQSQPNRPRGRPLCARSTQLVTPCSTSRFQVGSTVELLAELLRSPWLFLLLMCVPADRRWERGSSRGRRVLLMATFPTQLKQFSLFGTFFLSSLLKYAVGVGEQRSFEKFKTLCVIDPLKVSNFRPPSNLPPAPPRIPPGRLKTIGGLTFVIFISLGTRRARWKKLVPPGP